MTDEHMEFWRNLEERNMGEAIGPPDESCVTAGMHKGWKLLDMEKDPERALFTSGNDNLIMVCNEDGQGPYACEVS